MNRLSFAAAILLAASTANLQAGERVAYGRSLVEQNCARCHAVALTDRSAHPEAPAFRDLAQKYPVEALAEALGEGISTGHPDMPEFIATPEQVEAIIAYLESLEP